MDEAKRAWLVAVIGEARQQVYRKKKIVTLPSFEREPQAANEVRLFLLSSSFSLSDLHIYKNNTLNLSFKARRSNPTRNAPSSRGPRQSRQRPP